MTPNAEQVLAMLGSRPGPWTTAELETATGLSKPAVSKALGVLVERGQACRPTGKNGTYAKNRGQRP
jgi:DNA-binding IclR family transcriptional regulator